MNGKHFATSCLLTLAFAAPAAAQQQPVTVQLPTFSFFTVSTTVMVPDRGGIRGASFSHGNYGTVRVGPGCTPRVVGLDFGAAGIGISAHIHDFAEMEKALAAGEKARWEATPRRDPEVARLDANVRGGNSNLRSVAAIRREQQAAAESLKREAEALLAKARDAQSAGKSGIAKIYFRMAADKGVPEIRGEALAALRELNAGSKR